jgi:predicted ABC-type ATPase
MVAGPNGSGKSTLIAALRADPAIQLPTVYINADDLQRERGLGDAREAQALATEMRAQALASATDLLFETVMSHPSKLAELQGARAAGYHVTVHLVATDDVAINEARVGVRVRAGGHPVAPDLIRARYARTLALAPIAVSYADQALVWDNSLGGDTGGGLSLQAVQQGGRMAVLTSLAAGWLRGLAARVNERAVALETLARMPMQLAHLGQGDTRGPVFAMNRHYLLQLDEATQAHVVHDGALLGEGAKALALNQRCRIRYRQGVADLSD